MIVAKYRHDNEMIAISLYGNGKFYILYGLFDDAKENADCYSGGFETFEDAEKTLYTHRPHVRKGGK